MGTGGGLYRYGYRLGQGVGGRGGWGCRWRAVCIANARRLAWVDPCWVSVYDAGPARIQHRANISARIDSASGELNQADTCTWTLPHNVRLHRGRHTASASIHIQAALFTHPTDSHTVPRSAAIQTRNRRALR